MNKAILFIVMGGAAGYVWHADVKHVCIGALIAFIPFALGVIR